VLIGSTDLCAFVLEYVDCIKGANVTFIMIQTDWFADFSSYKMLYIKAI